MTPETEPIPYLEALERQKETPYDGSYLIALEPGTKEFTANGKRYFVRDSVSLRRYVLSEQFGLEYTLTGGMRAMFDRVAEAMQLMNKLAFTEAVLALDKVTAGIIKIEEKTTYAFQVCSLFITGEGEDLRDWTPELAAQKADDWNEAGLDAAFFLMLAAHLTPGFLGVYKSVSPPNLERSSQEPEESSSPA